VKVTKTPLQANITLDDLSEAMSRHIRSARLISTWKSRTSILFRYHLVANDSCITDDAVIKLAKESDVAPLFFRSMQNIAEFVDSLSIPNFECLRPLGMCRKKGFVVMPYVQGEGLDVLIKNSCLGDDREAIVDNYIELAGTLLGYYHQRFPAVDDAQIKEAQSDLETRLCDTLPFDHNFACNTHRVARSYGDYHPGHLIVTKNRKLVLIDPPLSETFTFIYRDISWFCYWLLFLFLRTKLFLSNYYKAYTRIRARFLKGYSGVLSGGLTAIDRLAIDYCEAFLIQRCLRKCSFWQRLYYLLPLTHRLRQLQTTNLYLETKQK